MIGQFASCASRRFANHANPASCYWMTQSMKEFTPSYQRRLTLISCSLAYFMYISSKFAAKQQVCDGQEPVKDENMLCRICWAESQCKVHDPCSLWYFLHSVKPVLLWNNSIILELAESWLIYKESLCLERKDLRVWSVTAIDKARGAVLACESIDFIEWSQTYSE